MSVNFPVYITCGIHVVTLTSEEYLRHMESFYISSKLS